MSLLARLQAANPDKDILASSDSRFRTYGRVINSPLSGDLLELARLLPAGMESGETKYIASDSSMEATADYRFLQDVVYGEAELQAGCCYGYNTRMNGMEYHRTSEIFIAATDLVLVLGRLQDVALGNAGEQWDSRLAEFFLLCRGECVELYGTTLHLAPCRVSADPFSAVIILPKGTNTPLSKEPAGSLWMKNKWLLAHPESPAAARGAHIGITGVNHEVYFSSR